MQARQTVREFGNNAGRSGTFGRAYSDSDRLRLTSSIPAFGEQFGQAYTRPSSFPNTRLNRSETCSPQFLQRGMSFGRSDNLQLPL